MSKKVFYLSLFALLLAHSFPAAAQQPKKIHRIGYLSSETAASESTRSEAIRLALREIGYIEGQNIAIEFRYGEGKLDRAPERLAELARLKVDIIVVTGGEAWIREAQNATRTIPIVMTGTGSDPVEEGLIESLACPGGNVTGLSSLNPELNTKRLEILKDAIPRLSRVGFLRSAVTSLQVKEIRAAAPSLKLRLEEIETDPDPKD